MAGAVASGRRGVTLTALPGSGPVFSLREDLRLSTGETDPTGRRGMILEDPLSQRFFRLDAEDAELLRFTGTGDSAAAARRAAAYLGRGVEADQIKALEAFLYRNHLVRAKGPQARQLLGKHLLAARGRRLTTFVQRYLFIRIPLVRPDRFLGRTLSFVAWLGSSPALIGFLALACFGGLLISRQWDSFVSSFPFFFSLEGVIALSIGITITKTAHELAHAYTAKAHGCRVPTIGVMLLVLLPLLYTDATESWRLNRRARLRVGIAGVASELAVASLALALWPFLPDGPLRSVLFTLATATWLFSLLINLNPLLRFDGYYVLSDWLNQPNLHPRSAALAGWWLRERLFAHGMAPPEPPRGWIIAFGIAAYLYRLVVFTGIALPDPSDDQGGRSLAHTDRSAWHDAAELVQPACPGLAASAVPPSAAGARDRPGLVGGGAVPSGFCTGCRPSHGFEGCTG